MSRTTARSITLFLAGDVMTGRGVDQALPHPCPPHLHEPWVSSAVDYLAMAERTSGPIPAPVDFAYVWGDALADLTAARPAARVVNLETAVTRAGHPAPKGIHYRMSPENLPVLAAAGIDACSLANNHVLDWGHRGLLDTLETLGAAVRLAPPAAGGSPPAFGSGQAFSGGGAPAARRPLPAGAGRNRATAEAPAVLPLPGGGRLLLFARAALTGGVPADWAAGEERPGVALLPDLSRRCADELAGQIAELRQPGDLVVVSIHWGPNWGYEVSRSERRFAHRLVEHGTVDLVHGHSSHHPRPAEVHDGRLILYGCGDFLNDYEGIGGHDAFRPDLVLGYLVTLARTDGSLRRVRLLPYRIRRLQLGRAPREDARWLADTLTREGKSLGCRVEEDAATGILELVG